MYTIFLLKIGSHTSNNQCNLCEKKLHSEEVSSIVTIRRLNLLNKTSQDNNSLHLRLFSQRKLRFSLLSCFLSFKSLVELFSFKDHNSALSWCHKFTLFSQNDHDHVKIRALLNIFSIRSISLKHILLSIFYQEKCFIVFL